MLKKIIGISCTAAFLAANPVKLTQSQIDKIKSEYSFLNRPMIVVDSGYDWGKYDQLKFKVKTPRGMTPSVNAYIVKDIKGVVFVGKAYDTKGNPITVPADAKVVNNGVAFTIGSGKKILYLVTDPQCPFCKRFEQNMDPNVLKEYTIKIIPFPLSFHRNAIPMYRYILSAPTQKEMADRYHKVLRGSNEWSKAKLTDEQIKKADDLIKKGQKAAEELKVQGTPSVYDSEFRPMDYTKLLKK